ncbi:MAG: hypothetical protein WCH84_07115 [Verrucomicrobiota bacterium]
MIRSILILTVLVSSTLCSIECSAEIVKGKGKGEIVYKGVFKQGSVEERAAITEAKKNALSRYAASFDSARFELYQKIEGEVVADIDRYVMDYTVVNQSTDTTSRRYTVIIEASINATLIEAAIQKSSGAAASAVAGTGKPSGESDYITFVFVARELASRKAFDAKRTAVEINESSNTGAEKTQISDDGQSANRSLEKSSITKKTTGGNTETKADELAYRVNTVTEVDNAVNSVLTKARYETVDPTDAGLDIQSFKKDFSSGDDISVETRKAATKTLKEKEVRYLAIANMDVGLPDKDAESGMMRVYVTVTAKVTDLKPKFPKAIASIAGKPYAGLGPDAQVAKKNALNDAAMRSAAELVDQLRMKNVN